MPESDKGLKTEQPTEKRLKEAVEEGNFAKVPDFQVVFVLVAAFGVVSFYGKEQARAVAEIAVGLFGGLARYQINAGAIGDWAGVCARTMAGLVMPICVACAAAGAIAGGIQSQFRVTPKVLDLKFSKLDPIRGFQRIFSGQTWVKLASDTLKLSILGTILWQDL
jgi:flagellar biosynthetic protein FlhB